MQSCDSILWEYFDAGSCPFFDAELRRKEQSNRELRTTTVFSVLSHWLAGVHRITAALSQCCNKLDYPTSYCM